MKENKVWEESCDICPRECKANRKLGQGLCGVKDTLRIGRIAPHLWEEPCISGEKGSGAVFFAGCNLKCVYCQNVKLSRGKVGREYTVEELAEEMLRLQEMGMHNINLVTPTHYMKPVVLSLQLAKKKGLILPVVYNTSGYEKVESLQQLEGLVDVYLPDFKYLSSMLAKKYSKAEDYPQVVKAAIEEMYRQVGDARFDKDGRMIKGVLIRHLVLPGAIEESKEVIKYIYETYKDHVFISIMNQYTPYGELESFPELQRPLTEEEYEEVVDYAIELGVENGFIQEGGTSDESFIPEFL